MSAEMDVALRIKVDASGDGTRAVSEDLARVEQAATSAAAAASQAAGGVTALTESLGASSSAASAHEGASSAAARGVQLLASATAQSRAASEEVAKTRAQEADGLRDLARAQSQSGAAAKRELPTLEKALELAQEKARQIRAEVEQLKQRARQTEIATRAQRELNREIMIAAKERFGEGVQKAWSKIGADSPLWQRLADGRRIGLVDRFEIANAAGASHLATAAHLKQAAEPILGASRQVLGATWGAVRSGIRLDAALGDASAASGIDAARLSALSSSVARGSAYTRTDVLAAARAMAARGLRGDRIDEGSLSDVLRFSTVTGLGASEAAGMLATAAQGSGERDFRRMTDMLLSASDPTQIARLFAAIGPKARAAGFGATDITLLTEALSQRGYEGDRAGEALNGVFAAMSDPARRGRLRRLGVTGEESGAAEMLSNIATKTAGMDERRQRKLLREAFGEGAPAIAALIGDADKLKQRDVELRDDAHLSAEAGLKEETTDGAARALAELASSLERLKESLSQNAAIQRTLTGAIRLITAIVDAGGWMVERFPVLSTALVGLTGGIGALLGALGGIAVVGSSVSTVLGLKKYLETLHVLNSAFTASARQGQLSARSLGKAALAFAAVTYAVEVIARSFGYLKGVFVGMAGVIEGGTALMRERLLGVEAWLRDLFGVEQDEADRADDETTRREIAAQKASAREKLLFGERSIEAHQAAGGGWAMFNPLDADYARKFESHMRRLEKESSREAGRSETALAITVKNDVVQVETRQGERALTLQARAGQIAAGGIG